MVYRGPQLVQLVKAYPYRRFSGSVLSCQTLRARRDVWRDEREFARLRHTRPYAEFAVAVQRQRGHSAILYPRQRRMLNVERLKESLDRPAVAFHFRNQAGGIIQHVPRELQPLRQIVYEWPEADALYDPPQPNLNAQWHASDKR